MELWFPRVYLDRSRCNKLRQTIKLSTLVMLLLDSQGINQQKSLDSGVLTTNMHNRTLFGILFRLAQDFMSNRSRVAFAKRDVLQ
jgi:hypothetical protein